MQRRPNKYLPTISIPPHQHSSIQRIDAPTNQQHFRAQPSCTTRRRNGGVDNDWACMTGCLRQFSRSPCVSLGISNIHGRVYTHVFKVVRVRVPPNQRGINAFWNLFGDKKQKLGRRVRELMHPDGDDKQRERVLVVRPLSAIFSLNPITYLNYHQSSQHLKRSLTRICSQISTLFDSGLSAEPTTEPKMRSKATYKQKTSSNSWSLNLHTFTSFSSSTPLLT